MRKLVILISIIVFITGDFYIVHAENSYNTIRIGGIDRYDTSANIANNFFNSNFKNMIVASGEDFPDAITGSILSKKLDAPILLVSKTAEEYKNWGFTSRLQAEGIIYILGGDGSINSLYEKLSKGYKSIRLSGMDRFSTNSSIVNHADVAKGTPVIIVNGFEFADALSASSISAIKGYPLIMSNKDKLNDNATKILKNIEPSQVFIIGGQGSINDNVVDNIKNIINVLEDSKIIRISGANRYETSLNICKYFNINGDTAIIASGEDFPDALSGSALAAKLNAPIILTNGRDISSQKNYLDTTNYKNLILIGGKSSISEEVENKLTTISNNSIVTFTDKNLENVIRKNINKPSGDIYSTDVKNIIKLDAGYSSINNLNGIDKLTNLRELNLSQNNITNIEALKHLVNLEILHLSNNIDLSDITPITCLYKLKLLNIGSTKIEDIKILGNLNNLTILELDNNGLSDISQLENLNNLTTLSLTGNQISDIDALKELTSLQVLYLSNNKLNDITDIKNLVNLNELYLNGNQITDISILKDLKNLNKLYLSGNQIANISVLKNLLNLNRLSLEGNPITDISSLKQLSNLKQLFLSDNVGIYPDIEQLKKELPNCTVVLFKPSY
ncbi:cell wall-binding repeat-containing protein [Clostridium sp. A1-XYC3]|uniref:Cell wall-binding repeat-containing protein n=1 Tax=Clostridium tanneri TaxID=3037988 RepID=A0ABU4JY40_9CLOT|nr:cell wall-binding repeat-containing protein [Clostridium sp. A1-XYC3]MDW8803070.1 cell wall-binding repeat-containing protein [Clostridium sp. A1-XYC3]